MDKRIELSFFFSHLSFVLFLVGGKGGGYFYYYISPPPFFLTIVYEIIVIIMEIFQINRVTDSIRSIFQM